MKTNQSLAAAFAVSLMLIGNGFAANVGSPQTVNVKFYDFWVSENADCTDLTRVYNNTSPSYSDMTAGPSFGQVNIANGTYRCVAFKMSDVVQLVPDYTSDWGHCVQGTTYTRDLFRSGDTSITPGGTTINGSGTNTPLNPIEDTMYIYLSVNGDNNNSCTSVSSPCKLNSPYIVSADNDAIMVWDFTNGIEDTASGAGGECSPETVTFGFRYQ